MSPHFNIPAAPPACRRARCSPTRNLLAGNAIFDLWGAASRAERGDAIDKVICVLPLFHIFALITILLRQIDQRQRHPDAPAF